MKYYIEDVNCLKINKRYVRIKDEMTTTTTTRETKSEINAFFILFQFIILILEFFSAKSTKNNNFYFCSFLVTHFVPRFDFFYNLIDSAERNASIIPFYYRFNVCRPFHWWWFIGLLLSP